METGKNKGDDYPEEGSKMTQRGTDLIWTIVDLLKDVNMEVGRQGGESRLLIYYWT